MSASDLTAADRTALKEVVAEKVGNVCGTNAAPACAASDVTVTVSRRAVAVLYIVVVCTAAAASAGAQTISSVSTAAMTTAIQAKTTNLASVSVTAVSSTTITTASTAPAEDAGSAEGDSSLVVIIVVVSVVVLVTIAGISYFMLRQQPKTAREISVQLKAIGSTMHPRGTAAPLRRFMVDQKDFLPRGDFSELEVIGEGSYCTVYKANFRGQTVAVKRAKTAVQTEIAEKTAKRELRVLMRFNHQNIVALRGVCMEDGKTCLLLQFAEQQSLR